MLVSRFDMADTMTTCLESGGDVEDLRSPTSSDRSTNRLIGIFAIPPDPSPIGRLRRVIRSLAERSGVEQNGIERLPDDMRTDMG